MWQTIKNVILSPTTWKTVCEHTHINLNKMHLQTKIPLLGFVHREFSWSVLTGEEVQMKVLSKTNSFFHPSRKKQSHHVILCHILHLQPHLPVFSQTRKYNMPKTMWVLCTYLTPKSQIFNVPSSNMRRFSGFRSRWTIFRSCKKANPSSKSWAISHLSFNVAFWMTDALSGHSANSIHK